MIKELRDLRNRLSPYNDPSYPVFWVSRYIYRNISYIFTYAICKTQISANMVSLVMLLVGFLSAWLLASGHFLTGVLVLHFWYFLDIVDGEVAREKKQSSLTGAYLDHLIHYLNQPAIFIGIGIGLNVKGMPLWLVVSAALAGYFDLVNRARNESFHLFALKKGRGYSNPDAEEERKPRLKYGTFYKLVTRSIQFPGVINILTVAVFLDYLLESIFGVAHYAVGAYVIYLGALISVYTTLGMFKDIVLKTLDK